MKKVIKKEHEKRNEYLAISPDHLKAFDFSTADNNFEYEPPYPLIYNIEENIIGNKSEKYCARLAKAAFSPDSKKVLYYLKDGIFILSDLNVKELQQISLLPPEVLEFQYKYPMSTAFKNNQIEHYSLAFSNTGNRILTYFNGRLQLSDLDGKILFNEPSPVISKISLSENGEKILVVFDDGKLQLLDWEGKIIGVYKGNMSSVSGLYYSPDREKIIIAFEDGKLQLVDWDGNTLSEFNGNKSIVRSLDFSLDLTKIIACSSDSTVHIWKVNGRLMKTLKGLPDFVSSAKLSPDGEKIATLFKSNTVRIWDKNGRVVQDFKTPYDAYDIGFSEDGQSIITYESGHYIDTSEVREWPIRNNITKEVKLDSTEINSITFSSDRDLILSASTDSVVRLWNRNGRLLKEIKKNPGTPSHIAFSQDNRSIIAIFPISYKIEPAFNGFDGGSQVILWDLDGKIIQVIKSKSFDITAFLFSTLEKKIILGNDKGTVEVWDLNGALVNEFSELPGAISCMSFSPDKKTVYAISEQSNVRYPAIALEILDLEKKITKEVLLEKSNYESINFTSDDKRIIAITKFDGGEVLDLNGNWVSDISFRDCETPLLLSVYSSGRKEVTQSIHINERYDLIIKDSDCLDTDSFIGHKDIVNDVAISPDGKSIVSGDRNGNMIFWKTQMPLKEFLASDNLEVFSAEERKRFNITNF